MIHFDLEGRVQDELVVGHAMSRREGVLMSIITHAVVVVAIVLLPQWEFFQDLFPEPVPETQPVVPPAEEEAPQTLVYLRPAVELPPPSPPQPNALVTPDLPPDAPDAIDGLENPLPESQGDSADAIPEPLADTLAGEGGPSDLPGEPVQEFEVASRDPLGDTGLLFEAPSPEPPRAGGGLLGQALRNLEQFVDTHTLDNPQGGASDLGDSIVFDPRGVNFDPWLRRFRSEVYRNWFIPDAARIREDRVVLQFNVQRSGRVTDLVVVERAAFSSLTQAAYNAMAAARLDPLPAEYALDAAQFTVTFFYLLRGSR